MQVVYICAALYKISTGTPASRGPSATAGLHVPHYQHVTLTCDKYRQSEPNEKKTNAAIEFTAPLNVGCHAERSVV